MTDAVIVSTARTGLAKSWRGAFNMTHGATLGGHATQAAVARAGIDLSSADRHELEIRGRVERLAVRTLKHARDLPAPGAVASVAAN